MKLEDLKDLFGKNVKVELHNNKIITGIFSSFEREYDNEEGRANIDIEKGDVLVCIYLDEIKNISAN